MASTIKLKRSSVAGKTPNTTNLSTGELALNLADKRLYSANSSAIFEIGSNPDSLSVGSGGFTIANGAITFPLADGDPNQVLQTDGSGQLSFGAVSGGGGGQTANVSLFANATTNLVTTQISSLQINDRVVANPDGFIKLLTGNAQELRVPYFGAPGVNLDNGIISVTGGVSVNATFTNYFGQVDADGTNLVASSPNNQLSIIGGDLITVSGSIANNTLTISSSASNILNALTSVDGAGSSLDADTLDGQEGSFYLNYNNLNNRPTVPSNTSDLNNDSNFISLTELSANGDLNYNSNTGVISFDETYSNPNELLIAIKTVDGDGTGLDADLLDGQHGSHYLNYNNFTNTPTILEPTTTSLTNYLRNSGNRSFNGNLTITEGLTVDGDALFSGNTTIVSKTTIETTDALIHLAANNEFSDILDIGFFGHFNSGSGNNHTGIIRDSGTKEYYIFSEYQPGFEPESNIDISDPTFALANVHVSKLYADNVDISNTTVIFANTNITSTGTITANEFVGDGSQLTGIETGSSVSLLKAKGTSTSSISNQSQDLTWSTDISADFASISGASITFSTSGTYLINVVARQDGTGRTETIIQTFVDTGGGFSELTDEIASNYTSRDADQDTGGTVLVTALEITSGEVYKFTAFCDADNNSSLLTAGTRLIITKLG